MAGVSWIKLTTNMFDNCKIKHLRRLPEGNSIVLIWVMLLTLAGRCNAGGMIFLTENIPYSVSMLADELDFEEATVQLAIYSLTELGMISTTEEGFLEICGWEHHQNIDKLAEIREYNRLAKRKSRAALNAGQTIVNDKSMTSQQCQDTDKDTDKDIEKEKNKNKSNTYTADFEKFWAAYPKKKAKEDAAKAFKSVDVPVDVLINAVNAQLRGSDWKKENGRFIPYPATWLRGRRWEDETQVSNIKDITRFASNDISDFIKENR